jgi:hypothetical protein
MDFVEYQCKIVYNIYLTLIFVVLRAMIQLSTSTYDTNMISLIIIYTDTLVFLHAWNA